MSDSEAQAMKFRIWHGELTGELTDKDADKKDESEGKIFRNKPRARTIAQRTIWRRARYGQRSDEVIVSDTRTDEIKIVGRRDGHEPSKLTKVRRTKAGEKKKSD